MSAARSGEHAIILDCEFKSEHGRIDERLKQLESRQEKTDDSIGKLVAFTENLRGFLVGLAALAAGVGALAGLFFRAIGH